MIPSHSLLFCGVSASALMSGGSIPPVDTWETLFDAPGHDNGSWNNYTARSVLTRPVLPASFKKIRLTYSLGEGAANMVRSSVFVGIGEGIVFRSKPKQVFFGGAPGFTLSAGQSIVSDEIELPYSGVGTIVVSDYGNANSSHSSASVPFVQRGYNSGNLVETENVAMTSLSSGTYVSKIEVFGEYGWEEIFQPVGIGSIGGYNNFTLRTRIDADRINPAGSTYRFYIGAGVSKAYVGYGEATPESLNFDGSPIQLTFRGGQTTNANYYSGLVSDPVELPDAGIKPLIVSVHSNESTILQGSITSGFTSRYAAGDSANSPTFTGAAQSGGVILGLVCIDAMTEQVSVNTPPQITGSQRAVQNTSTTSVTVSSGSPAEGELIILHLAHGTNLAAGTEIVWPAGFTQGGRLRNTRACGAWAWKVAAVGEPANYTVNWSAGDTRSILSLVALSGHDGVAGWSTDNQDANTNTFRAPHFGFAQGPCRRLVFFSGGWGGGTATMTPAVLSPVVEEVLAPVLTTSGSNTDGTCSAAFTREEPQPWEPAFDVTCSFSIGGGGIFFASMSVVVRPAKV